MIQAPLKNRVVGIDISIEQTVYAIVDMRGNILAKTEFATTDFPTANDFVTYLSDNILPFVEAKYRVIGDKGHRAVMGCRWAAAAVRSMPSAIRTFSPAAMR